MMSSTGEVWAQPPLGRAADVWGYGPSYLISGGIGLLALPALALSRRQNTPPTWWRSWTPTPRRGRRECRFRWVRVPTS